MIKKKYMNVSWLPKKSTMSIDITNKEKREYGKTTSVFAFVFVGDNEILLLEHTNKKRGIEIPGGHIDPGETPLIALHREVMEEVGATIKDVELVGYQFIEKSEPEEKYPELKSNQMFFKAKLNKLKDVKLFEDSQGRKIMKISEFKKYLKSKNEPYYLELFESSINNNELNFDSSIGIS